jgi:glycosyltransferase involved in cell wall biosynthesis
VRDRVRFIQVDHGTRAAPLNAGFDAAVGQYIAILDDDDIVLGNWVEVFRDLARESPGSVLRAMSVTQDSQVIHTQFSERSSCTTSPPRSIYPTTFQLVDHLRDNGTPSMTMAFPRSYVSTLGVRFDESLTTAEDWEYLVRAAFVCGVASAPVVTSIYRVWTNRENSSSIHSRKEWVENHGRIHEKHDRTPFLMPPGTTKVIRDILNERDELRACVKRLDEELRWANSKNQVPAEIMRLIDESENVPENVEASRAQIIAILNSTSWKLTSALRAIKRISLGAPAAAPDLSSMSSHELRQLIEAMRHSTSWRITAPIRQSAPLARKLKVKAKRITRRFS